MSPLFSAVSVLVFCSTSLPSQTHDRTAQTSDALLARAREWVETWNNKDVEGMRRLHATDVSRQLYGLGANFGTMEALLSEIREKNFWNLTWSLRMVEPRVRNLGPDAALVTFRLMGTETPKGGTAHPFAGAFSLIFQRIRSQWLVVHVHDSSPPPAPAGAPTDSRKGKEK